MVDPHTNGCPEPEVLAAYVDQGLSLAERARVDAHLASCPQCIALLAGVARTVAEVSAHVPDAGVPAEATPLVTRRSMAGAVAAAAAVIAVLALPSLVRPWLDRDAGLVSLVDGVGEQRSVLGRLTGGFPHAPLGVPSAGGQGGRPAGADRVLLTAGKIRESFGERETPSQLHALGVSQLLAGRYDDAAQALLAASREQPANAKYLNDVATVQLERARLGLRPDDLPRALASADRALRLDASLNEAWFNRALALSSLSLRDQSRAAWADYLKRDSSSAWASEARSWVDKLSAPTAAQAWTSFEGRLVGRLDQSLADEAVRTHVTEARNFFENTLVANWANAVVNGESGEPELASLRTMAAAMLRIADDSIYVDAVAAIDRATSVNGLRHLAQAHQQFIKAAALLGEDRLTDALPAFKAAREQLGSTPFGLLARVNAATIAFVSGQQNEATDLLMATLPEARSKGYSWAAGRSSWVLGLIAVGQSRFDEGESRYQEALDAFEHMGDAEQIGTAHNLLAVLYDYLGDVTDAWRHRVKAFEALSVSRSPKLQALILATAVPSLRADSPETALALQDAALAVARRGGREASIAENLTQRASLLSDLNRSSEAAADASEARSHLAKIPDAGLRNRVEVGLLATESDLARPSNPAVAVAAATKAIGLVRQRNDRLRIAQLNLRLAQANIVWGRQEEARVALNQGLAAFNAERLASTEERPVSALDESWKLFENAVQLALKDKDYPRAFALADAARSRSAAESAEFGSVALATVEKSLSAGEAIVALNQFEDELAIWIIRASGTRVASVPISRNAAVKLVARQQDDIWRQSTSTDAARELYNVIIRPVARDLTDAKRLIFVPDSTFQNVSFSALYDSTRAQYLVEQKTLRRSLSGSSFVAATIASRTASNGNPLIFDVLGTRSSDELRAVYQHADIRAGADATRERLFAEGAGRSVVHISARTSANENFPLLSRLLLEDGSARRSDSILGRDVVQRRLPNTELVVVDNGDEALAHRGEGTSSFARAFLAAGVPAVLGTLPGADESATRDLMIAFHREISKGISAEQALQTVQRNAIQQNGRRLGAWTALVLYGSDR